MKLSTMRLVEIITMVLAVINLATSIQCYDGCRTGEVYVDGVLHSLKGAQESYQEFSIGETCESNSTHKLCDPDVTSCVTFYVFGKKYINGMGSVELKYLGVHMCDSFKDIEDDRSCGVIEKGYDMSGYEKVNCTLVRCSDKDLCNGSFKSFASVMLFLISGFMTFLS